MFSRNVVPGGFNPGGFGGFSGPVPRDLVALVAVVFATFTLQFFAATAIVPALLRLTPLAWQRGFVWQLATYPFIGFGGPSLWFLLELLILFWFGRDVFLGLRRRHFWRLILWSAVGAALVAVAVHALTGLGDFQLMQGQRMLLAIMVAAFATANGEATILLFFILPIRARWFLGLEILFAFMGFLATRDLAGFLGITAAVGLTYLYIRSSGSMRGGRKTFREMRLRLERWWIQKKLEQARRKRGLRVIPGEGRPGPRGPRDPNVKPGPWVH
jgi:hypothetical protein